MAYGSELVEETRQQISLHFCLARSVPFLESINGLHHCLQSVCNRSRRGGERTYIASEFKELKTNFLHLAEKELGLRNLSIYNAE